MYNNLSRNSISLFASVFVCRCVCVCVHDNPPAKIKEPTHEMNPDRNELKGNVPTSRQYTN